MSKTDSELRLIGQLTRSLEGCPAEQRTRVLEYLTQRFATTKVVEEPGPAGSAVDRFLAGRFTEPR